MVRQHLTKSPLLKDSPHKSGRRSTRGGGLGQKEAKVFGRQLRAMADERGDEHSARML